MYKNILKLRSKKIQTQDYYIRGQDEHDKVLLFFF